MSTISLRRITSLEGGVTLSIATVVGNLTGFPCVRDGMWSWSLALSYQDNIEDPLGERGFDQLARVPNFEGGLRLPCGRIDA